MLKAAAASSVQGIRIFASGLEFQLVCATTPSQDLTAMALRRAATSRWHSIATSHGILSSGSRRNHGTYDSSNSIRYSRATEARTNAAFFDSSLPTVRRFIHSDDSADSNIELSKERQIHIQPLHGKCAGVVTLTLNRPEAANAMGRTMLSQLQDAIGCLSDTGTSASDISNARCVIVVSSSSKVFSAGADLRERSKMTPEDAAVFVASLRSTFDSMAGLPMPVIAAVEGVAVGGGLEIALTSDVIVAGSAATFGLPETSLAIIPGAGGTQRLPRLIGPARAKELIFSGRRIDTAAALEYGLVQHAVPAGQAETKALEIARDIARNGPVAVRAAKAAVTEGMEAPTIADAMKIERRKYQIVIPTSDRQEGLAAFREKRMPEYKGR